MDRFKIATIIISFLFCVLLSLPTLVVSITYVSLIPAAAAISTLYFGLIKYWIDSDLIFKSLFTEFNKRFDEINENLNNVTLGNTVSGNKTSEQIIQDYLNLCVEEYYWFKKGRIPTLVWQSWSAGINYYLTFHVIREFFDNQLLFDDSYYGFIKSTKPKN